MTAVWHTNRQVPGSFRGDSLAVVAWLIGSPIIDFNTFMLLIPLVAPMAWPAEGSPEPAVAVPHFESAPVGA